MVTLLLFSQKKSIGEASFAIVMGALWVFGIFLGGADLRFSGLDELNFQIAPLVVFVPFMAAMLMVYISDGVLAMQRLMTTFAPDIHTRSIMAGILILKICPTTWKSR